MFTSRDLDDERCYRIVESHDARFDGWFFTAVRTTGIYCRPSCPATTPRRQNVTFHATAAAAQLSGYRACKRCRPDASPGSPEWNSRADVVGRAMRLIADGVVDREGVPGLARRLSYSERHLNRLLTGEVGAGPIALARAQRAHTARTLIETTTMPITDVAFAAGFASVRQFNDTIREVFASTPTDLRLSRRGTDATGTGIHLRLPFRTPISAAPLFRFLGERAVAGVERFDVASLTYARVLDLPHGAGTVELAPGDDHVSCALRVDDTRDVATAVQRCRRLLDLDADPRAVDDHLGDDPALGPLVAARPGLRSPGHVDGAEVLVRAILGQQVSVAGARTLAGRLVAAHGKPIDRPLDGLTHRFPDAATLADIPDDHLAMPVSRRRALRAACRAVADGTITIDPGADPETLTAALVNLRGIGPWTAGYVVMRALGHPDTFLPTDLGVRHGLAAAGIAGTPTEIAHRTESWRPWRSYALHHLWSSL